MGTLSSKALEIWTRYDRHINSVAFVVGFSFDLYLAKRPDSIADNILLLAYLIISAGCIIILNKKQTRRKESEPTVEPLALLLILQFCYGGLANNLLILYGKSGTLSSSLLFIGLLVSLIVGNELLRSRYALLRFNVAVYYVLLLTYVIIAAPTFIFHAIGTNIFVFSTLISVAFMALFLTGLYIFVLRGRDRKKQLMEVSGIVIAIFLAFNGLYALQIIPPVPLSAKAVGIYHSLSRDSKGNFQATYEPAPWYAFWRDTNSIYTYTSGEIAYCFSAIFAPGDLRTPITHRWEYYSPAGSVWESKQSYTFSILGGRAGGYRGYSANQNLTPGEWRCDVETARGQIISRIPFTVVASDAIPPLSTTTL